MQTALAESTLPLTTPENSLLASLPFNERNEVMTAGERITAPVRRLFFDVGEQITEVYFPLTGMASLMTVLNDGTALERMAVGHEGFVGLPLFNGVLTHSERCVCQVEGDFHAVSARAFKDLLKRAPHLQTTLQRYVQFTLEVMAQTAACNSLHLLEQRCARWLLTTMDAVQTPTFNLTQEFLSQMLAVRRSGVTVAMGTLERQGLIAHRYGEVTIVDVDGLATIACECYRTIKTKQSDLFSEIGNHTPSESR